AAAAITALESFGDWAAAAAAGPDEGRDPRLGRRLWEAKLWHTLDTELTASEVLRLARTTLTDVTERIREAAVELVGGRFADDTPDDATIVALAQVTLAETTDFVREHDLVSLVDDPCVIEEMPEFSRGVAVAYCDSPGPLETAPLPTFYCIAPTPSDWTPER